MKVNSKALHKLVRLGRVIRLAQILCFFGLGRLGIWLVAKLM